MQDKINLIRESDAWFLRNKNYLEHAECSDGMKIFSTFYDQCRQSVQIRQILEVGCANGYNLMYMNKKYGISGYGIDPSQKAVEYGNAFAENERIPVALKQGFADALPYENESFDMVYLGFCVYQFDRNALFKAMSEADRVLSTGGFCVITDFDTPTRYIRDNIHSSNIPTYKTDCSVFFLPYGYTLVEKRMYTHASKGFVPNIQERLSTQILYKEPSQNIYVRD